MKLAKLRDDQLNAFVDGELTPPQAARVAEALAADPVLAQKVARLHALKYALAGFAEELPLPQVAPVKRPRRPVWRKRAALAAVSAMLVLTLGAVPRPAPEGGDGISPRLQDHDQWLEASASTAPAPMPDGFDWLLSVTEASQLQLVRHHVGAEGAHFGFRGPNACRLSLFISAAEGADRPLRLLLTDAVQHATWQAGGLSFEMIARDMAAARFASVATGLEQGSTERAAPSQLHIALVRSARLPCMA